MAFKYRARSSEDNARRTKQTSGAYDSYLRLPTYRPKAGENCIRIVPWLDDDRPDAKEQAQKWAGKDGEHWGIDILVHYNVGGDNGMYLCLKMKHEPCPVCDARQNSTDEKERDDLQAKARILCWLIDRDNPASGVQLWAMPLNLSKDITKRATVRGGGGWLAVDDPEEGYDIFFDKEGEKDRSRYKNPGLNQQPSPLSANSEQKEGWLNYTAENFLPDLLQYYEYDHIERVLFGSAEDTSEPAGREEGIARGRHGEQPVADERPQRPRRESPPAEREETVTRGNGGDAPWENERDKAAEQAQETREAVAEAVPTRRYRPVEPPKEEVPADDDHSAEVAREALKQFQSRRRRG